MYATKTLTFVGEKNGEFTLPVDFVPTPTDAYRRYRKERKVTVQPGAPVPAPLPIPLSTGSRVLIWKQDPSVSEIGVRKCYLPGVVLDGPRDARLATAGLPVVNRNAFGDFIQTPGSDAFDAVHAYTVARQTLTMYQRALGGQPLPWQWNGPVNTEPLAIFPHGLPNTMNAYYSRTAKALKFGDFDKPGSSPIVHLYTCRSFDIVAHETGHAILDGLKPYWILMGNPPQTGGLHESFGDLSCIFLALAQMDQVEAIIAQTKGNLHNKTFLADLAEEFGLALGRPNGLRNADNDLKLKEAGTEVHAISQVFTGAIYDIMADIFDFERTTQKVDDAFVLYSVGQYMCSLVLRALIAAPDMKATYADVANQMIKLSLADGKPLAYRQFIQNRFVVREVVLPAPAAFAGQQDFSEVELAPAFVDDVDAVQNRSTCCGTMQSEEYNGDEEAVEDEIQALLEYMSTQNGRKPTSRRQKSLTLVHAG